MIDRSTIDRIYAAANIVDVVGDFVKLRRAGANFQACCPFHTEKTPSFVVSPSKGIFKCFGCGKKGNAVTFVMEHEKMTYAEALKYVAKKYGIEVQEREESEEEKQRNDDRESMMVVNSWASDYFCNMLHETDEGLSVGLGYFRSRGFTDATIKKFGLGYCPAKGDAMSQAALTAGYKEQFLVDTGLTIKRESGGYYDRFCGRVIFPIHSISGRVTAFGGRILRKSDRTAKYLNSPESLVYSKSNSLYGLYFAKNAITRENYCILVEGYTDVIQMHQKGIENVVASSGTSLTTEQIRLISRFTKNVTVIYDGDAAGIKASLRGIDMILREGMNVRVVALPPEDDPDSFARTHSAEQIRDYIQTHEEDFISFKANLLMAEATGDPIRKSELIKDIVRSIAEIPDRIRRSVFIKDCAKSMDIDEQILIDEVARLRITMEYDKETGDFIRSRQQRQRQQQIEEQRTVSIGKVEPGSNIIELEKEIVGYLLKYGHQYFEYRDGKNVSQFNIAETIFNELDQDDMTLQDARYRAIMECYREQFNELGVGEKIPEYIFTNHINPEVCNASVDILTADSNYSTSELWKRHEIIIEQEEERLSEAVPRAVTLYKTKTVEQIIKSLQEQLNNDSLTEEQEEEIMRSISALNEVRIRISKKLSRLIL
ncbi:MAG: DNA primase [Tidjanibacter sp.]|nr:DNA primase [Tidjanibacter sp.]